tara:strand:- start:1147 stop:2208 length:1062 start_codon:yes stop_codon:yes gene_type:complete
MLPLYLWGSERKDLEIHYCRDTLNNKSSSGDVLIIIRRYEIENLSKNIVENELTIFSQNFKKVIYFDDSAALSKINWFIVNKVDSYWKRGLLKDRSLYEKVLYGGRLYSDFYNKRYFISDKIETNSELDDSNKYDWNKVEIAWNIGLGMYMLSDNFLNVNFNKYLKKGSGYYSSILNSSLNRFIGRVYYNNIVKELRVPLRKLEGNGLMGRITSYGYSKSVGYQRLILENILRERNIATDRISPYRYFREMKKSRSVISPFGWGEICFRDFESILLGKVLIKPNCDHLTTWPNIYQEGMYIPIDWSLSNLDYAVEKSNDKNSIELVNNSRSEYLRALLTTTKRVGTMIEKLFS